MAAQTSTDAQAPVSLALLKLGAFFMWEWVEKVITNVFTPNLRKYHRFLYSKLALMIYFFLQNYGSLNMTKIGSLISDDWDIYVMTGLAFLLGILVLLRRMH